MAFDAQLHIQGVGCYAPFDDGKKLLVIFPDGRPRPKSASDLCLHLNCVQFHSDHLTERPAGLDGYVTRFVRRELVTVKTGPLQSGIEALSLDHVPHLEDALPGEDQAHLRAIDSFLLDPVADDIAQPKRVAGKILIESGSVGSHINEAEYSGRWYFPDANEARLFSSVTTVSYTQVEHFELCFQELGSGNNGGASIELRPNDTGHLEVWIRNMCDGYPPPMTSGYAVRSTLEDEDFVLNYKIRGISNSAIVSARSLPIPRLEDGNISTVSRKCMGSV